MGKLHLQLTQMTLNVSKSCLQVLNIITTYFQHHFDLFVHLKLHLMLFVYHRDTVVSHRKCKHIVTTSNTASVSHIKSFKQKKRPKLINLNVYVFGLRYYPATQLINTGLQGLASNITTFYLARGWSFRKCFDIKLPLHASPWNAACR